MNLKWKKGPRWRLGLGRCCPDLELEWGPAENSRWERQLSPGFSHAEVSICVSQQTWLAIRHTRKEANRKESIALLFLRSLMPTSNLLVLTKNPPTNHKADLKSERFWILQLEVIFTLTPIVLCRLLSKHNVQTFKNMALIKYGMGWCQRFSNSWMREPVRWWSWFKEHFEEQGIYKYLKGNVWVKFLDWK